MATLRITNKTLEVVTEGDSNHWLVRWLKSSWTGQEAESPSRDLLQLSMFRRVKLERKSTPLTATGLLQKGIASKYYWQIILHDMHGNSTPVIGSRDEEVMKKAFTQIDTALNTDKPFNRIINIQDSTVVTGSVGRDVNNKGGGGDEGPTAKSK